MAKLTRKQLLTGGATGAAALAVMAAHPSSALASSEGGHIRVHAHGVLTLTAPAAVAGQKIAMNVDVAGRRRADGVEPVAGSGWDPGIGGTNQSGTTMVPVSSSGACFFGVAGHVEDHMVHLEGFSFFTNRLPADSEEPARQDTRADIRIVKVDADLKTGEIHFQLGAALASGTGVVVKFG